MVIRILEKICIGKFSINIFSIIIKKKKVLFPFFKNFFFKVLKNYFFKKIEIFFEINIKNVKRKLHLFRSFVNGFSILLFYSRRNILLTILEKKSPKKYIFFKYFKKFCRKIKYVNSYDYPIFKNPEKISISCQYENKKIEEKFYFLQPFSLKTCITHRECKNIYFNVRNKKETMVFLSNIIRWGSIFFSLFKKIKYSAENLNISNLRCISYFYSKKKTCNFFLTIRNLLFWEISFLFYKFICPIGKITTKISGYVSSCGHLLSKISITGHKYSFYYKHKIIKKKLLSCICCLTFDPNLKHFFLACDFFKFPIHS